MSRFDPKNGYQRPHIQMIPLIDIMFFALVFFMILSVYYHVEAQMDIRIPKATEAKETQHSSTAVVINVNTAGEFMVNGDTLTPAGLEELLKKLSILSPDQAVIIRADEKTFHKYIIETLDICARNNIRDISFATSENPQE